MDGARWRGNASKFEARDEINVLYGVQARTAQIQFDNPPRACMMFSRDRESPGIFRIFSLTVIVVADTLLAVRYRRHFAPITFC